MLWKPILKKMHVTTNVNKTRLVVENFKHVFHLTNPFCEILDLQEIVDLKTVSLSSLHLFLNNVEKTGFTLYLQERNKRLRRALVYSQEVYTGPTVSIHDLQSPKLYSLLLKLSQVINAENDANNPCVNYPSTQVSSYGECDRLNIRNFIKENYGLIPFWLTDNTEEVTKHRYTMIDD